ncbi:hypothetical protein A2U01_0016269 [Trifolium medium]|uniref:Gag-pol polyprotein n=1 Tax=Trifolium medium TaxID=97028 RepID=A0A392N9Z6_9FABA|nr:hypothetical protein [Trifolium medium]
MAPGIQTVRETATMETTKMEDEDRTHQIPLAATMEAAEITPTRTNEEWEPTVIQDGPPIEIKGTHDKLKCYIFEKGLGSDTKFKEKLGLEESQDMQDLLSRAQNYINYEEKMLGEKAEKTNIPPKKDERAREERGWRGPRGGYPEYTHLNTSREKILQDCLNTEFADTAIRPPREIRENSRTDKSKFCRYHKSAGHDNEDCIQLKDPIEDLIKLGKLNRYTKEENHRGYKKRKYDPSRRNPRKSESPKRK